MQACDRCHARKTRCDRRIPQCGACERAGAPCLHADKLRQRNLPRGYLDSIENLVKQLRQENRTLQDSLKKAEEKIKSQNLATAERAASQTGSTPSSQLMTDGPSLQGKGSPDSNAFAVEVGYLTLIATGETRYLGSSSGLGLANLINTITDLNGDTGFTDTENDAPGCSSSPKTPMGPSDALFPTIATAMPCIETYFLHTHHAFPLLHRPSFLDTVNRIYSEPNYYETHLFESFVFDMVLTIGSSNVNRFQETSASSSLYFNMAQSKITSIAKAPSLQSLLAILLISQHGIFSNHRDNSASIWHLAGLGARMCFELGLHLEPGHPNLDPSSAHPATTISLDQEMRKRCFWCLYNLDRIVSITLGRPVIIRDEEIDISLPSHLDDDFFGEDRPIQITPEDGCEPARISPFLHIIRIRRLSGRILNLMYISRDHRHISLEEKRRTRCKLHEELNAWNKDTDRLSLSPNSGRNYVSSFLTREWYTAVYNNAILLLYRPSPYLPRPMMLSSSEGGHPELANLLSAAKKSIESYSSLHRKRRLNYSWITLHGIFIAGLSYIYGTSRLLGDPTTRDSAPSIMCIIEVTQACSHVLAAISERWNTSRRSCELFNNLSNNLIREALHGPSKRTEDAQMPATNSASCPGPRAADRPTPSTQDQASGIQLQHPSEAQMGIGMTDLSIEVNNTLIMDKFKDYNGSFDFTSQRESFNFSDLFSGFPLNWSLDSPFGNVDGELVNPEVS